MGADSATTQKVLRCLQLQTAAQPTARRQGDEGLRKLGAKAIPALIAILTGRDPMARDNDMLRTRAALQLYAGSVADRAAAEALIEAIHDPSSTVRSMSAQALSRVGRF